MSTSINAGSINSGQQRGLATALLTLVMMAITQVGVAAPVIWQSWTFDYDVSGNYDGLSLQNVTFQGRPLITKLSLPVMRVFYDSDACGPYADRLGGTLSPIPWANNATLAQREFTLNGQQWYEIGIRDQIGSYDIYQVYYLSADGTIDAHIYSKGLQCVVNHIHYPDWRINFGLDGVAEDQILRDTGSGFEVMTQEFDANATSATNHAWRVRDATTGLTVDVLPGFPDFVIPDGSTTVPVTTYSNNTVFGRVYRSTEDTGWTYGPNTQVPFNNGESLAAADTVLWYEGYLPHSSSEGSALWHSTGIRLVANLSGTPPPPPPPPPPGSAGTSFSGGAVSILDNQPGAPYPSTVNVSNLSGTITKVTVRLDGFSHTYPDDVDMALVGPGGQAVMLMSDAGGSADLNGVSLTFDGSASAALPDASQIASGAFRPANYDGTADAFAAPAPGGTFGTSLDVFNGQVPNGTWRLYVVDDAGTDVGSIGSWVLTVTTTDSTPPPPDSTPETFSFTDISGALPGTVQISNAVTITGINTATPISVVGGEYAVGCGASFTAVAGTVSNGQTVCVRHTSAATNATGTDTTLTVGGVGETFTSTTSTTPPPGTGETRSFSGGAVSVLDNQPGAPYPSTVNVSNLSGTITKVTVRLDGLSHTYPDDVDLALVGPGGQAVMLMSDAGGSADLNSVSLTFDSSASPTLPDASQLASGAFRPMNYGATDAFAAPAPGGTYSTSLSTFNGLPAAGNWRLYVVDDAGTDVGSIGSWVLTVTTTTPPPPDVTPEAFTLDDVSGVALETVQISNAVTITGINTAAPISVVGGEYAIGCGATFTAVAGTVSNGQTVCVRHTSAATNATGTDTTLTVGGVGETFTSTTSTTPPPPDVTPEAFTLDDVSGVALETVQISNAVTITGINTAAPISVVGGEYAIGCGATFTAVAGTVSNGQTVCVRHTSAATNATGTDTTLTVGGVGETFTSTTSTTPPPPDVTPEAFTLDDVSGVALETVQISNAVTITGINTAAPISVVGGEYAIGCGATFTAVAGTVSNGQTVCVRHTSAATNATGTDTTLTVGGVGETFTSTTSTTPPPPDVTPEAFTLDDVSGVALETVQISNAVTITGINTAAPISVVGGEYAIGCGATFTAVAGTVSNGQTVCVRHTSAATNATGTDTTLTVGGVGETFTSTTLPPGTGETRSFSGGAVSVLDNQPGAPYPSTVNVSNLGGTIAKVTVRLDGLSHTYPDDVDLALVGPGGQAVMLMSDAGGSADLNGVSLTFDSSASPTLPDASQIASGVFRPANYGATDAFAAPAPGGTYGTSLDVFNGQAPNGTWRLYVVDDEAVDAGTVGAGWVLTITTQ